jgi:hypothetical protein
MNITGKCVADALDLGGHLLCESNAENATANDYLFYLQICMHLIWLSLFFVNPICMQKMWKHIDICCAHIYMCLIQFSLFFVKPRWKNAEAYTNLDNVRITYIYLHVLDPVQPLLCEPNVEN